MNDLTPCFFAADLHGREDRYEKLFQAIERERPSAVFLGGDLFPSYLLRLSPGETSHEDFIGDVLQAQCARLKHRLKEAYPTVYLILGNDDPREYEERIVACGEGGLWQYIHNKRTEFKGFAVYGYACVPPTPFRLKDWERYDVSQFVDPGCIHPADGVHTVPVEEAELKRGTIKNDLERLAGTADLSSSVFLFHTPPYDTDLDRAALDGVKIDHAPLDVHVGSIAVRRFIEARRPAITLHGHIHESARLTGSWKQRIGTTWMFSAAHDGPELSLVRFSLEHPDLAARELL